MRVVRYENFNGINGLYVGDMPDPEAAPGTVVVKVRATGINPGALAALHGASFTPARDLAGEVVALGAEVEGVAVGDAVLGWAQDWLAHAQLVAALNGVHTLLATIGGSGAAMRDAQLALIPAAIETGVQRFAPSEYAGMGYTGIDLYAPKADVWAACQAAAGSSNARASAAGFSCPCSRPGRRRV